MSMMKRELQRQLDTYLNEMRVIQSATEHHAKAEHLLMPKIVAVYGAMIMESKMLLDMEWYWANDSDQMVNLCMQAQWVSLSKGNPLVCIQMYGSAVLLDDGFRIHLTHVHRSTGEEFLQLSAIDPVNLIQFCNAYGIIVYGLTSILKKAAEQEVWYRRVQTALRQNLDMRLDPAEQVLASK